ncbi:MAG: hypothetical protein M9894_22965 [Planctomycetes bacterium]|nr:hypothetical protein [Planctomycetota bacterium]
MHRLLALGTFCLTCLTACVADSQPPAETRPPAPPPVASPTFWPETTGIELSLLPQLAVSTTREPGGELLDASFDVADLLLTTFDPDALVAEVRAACGDDAWAPPADLRLEGGRLEVRQTAAVLALVQDELAALRRTDGLFVMLEVWRLRTTDASLAAIGVDLAPLSGRSGEAPLEATVLEPFQVAAVWRASAEGQRRRRPPPLVTAARRQRVRVSLTGDDDLALELRPTLADDARSLRLELLPANRLSGEATPSGTATLHVPASSTILLRCGEQGPLLTLTFSVVSLREGDAKRFTLDDDDGR